MKIAHTIEVTDDQIIIEGVPFDLYVRDDVDYGTLDGKIGFVTMSVYTDNLIVNGKQVHSTMELTPSQRSRVESEWVKRESKRIVHEGMARILEWITASQEAELEDFPQRYMAGLPNGSQATMMTDNSNTI